MKKALFSFAIVAAGLLVASCGNKSGNAKEAEPVEAEVVDETPVAAAAECDNFTLTAPAGLKFNENASSSTSITLDAPDYGQFESVTIYLNKEEKSAEKLRDQYYGDGAGKEKADDVTIGNLTFKQLYYTESADNNSDLFAEVEGGVLVLSLSKNVPVQAEALKPLVESIKLK
ncbi:MAG: hypothetical protein IKH32_02770 [Prevotella sp.]|jgi:hypothetical protein|nr:hypothetical protein [Prevotella sp.]